MFACRLLGLRSTELLTLYGAEHQKRGFISGWSLPVGPSLRGRLIG